MRIRRRPPSVPLDSNLQESVSRPVQQPRALHCNNIPFFTRIPNFSSIPCKNLSCPKYNIV